MFAVRSRRVLFLAVRPLRASDLFSWFDDSPPYSFEVPVKYSIVAVYDRKVGAFMTPVAVVSIAQAQRSFLKEVEEGGEFFKLRADVSLWVLGELDEVSGDIDTSMRREVVERFPG